MHSALRPALRRFALPVLFAALSSAAAADAGPRPFSGRFTLTETVQFTGQPPCFALGSLQAVGNASHLGRTTTTSNDCINPVSAYDPGSFAFASMGSGASGLVFTAANGDQVFATYSGTLTAQPSGPHKVAGQFVITGGTGRVAGATGGGTLSGYEDISQVVTGRGEVELVGTIRY